MRTFWRLTSKSVSHDIYCKEIPIVQQCDNVSINQCTNTCPHIIGTMYINLWKDLTGNYFLLYLPTFIYFPILNMTCYK